MQSLLNILALTLIVGAISFVTVSVTFGIVALMNGIIQ